MKLGVFGGTFDPIHLGHLILAEAAREQLRLDRVRFLPAGDPWRKAMQDVSPAKQRLAMVELAVADNPAFEVDDSEVLRDGPTYTVETLRQLRARLGADDDIVFIVGEDALADMPFWHDPAGIAALVQIAVVPRAGADLPILPFAAERIVRVEMPYIGISSTDLRRRAREGLSLRYLVPAAVDAYIVQNGLYKRLTG
jgi:nicotinate-nucleotide adenylyltransferase